MDLSTLHIGLFGSAFALGLRHGIDLDHIVSIGGIVSVERWLPRKVSLALAYALGHAIVVLLFGGLAVGFGAQLSGFWVNLAGKLAGVSLVTLGIVVAVVLVRSRGRAAPLATRGTLVIAAARCFASVLNGGRKGHVHRNTVPARGGACAALGAIHGVGAETPSQLLLFVLAAGASSVDVGALVVVAFVVGLLLANLGVTIVLAISSHGNGLRVWLHRPLLMASAVGSVGVGVLSLVGTNGSMPGLPIV